MNLIIPRDYNPVLNTRDTEIAIKLVKDFFERELAKALNLVRVSAPIMVTPQSGLNDNLNGVERPVSFDILETGETAEIVQSLAKWKRLALRDYGFQPGEGLYTDMNAIRRDEVTDNIHSILSINGTGSAFSVRTSGTRPCFAAWWRRFTIPSAPRRNMSAPIIRTSPPSCRSISLL